jgi:hypothetical protein
VFVVIGYVLVREHFVVFQRSGANLMTKDEARKIAAGIAKLPELQKRLQFVQARVAIYSP